jgi:hypothetical protein
MIKSRVTASSQQSKLEDNPDGLLTPAFAPNKPEGVPKPNWLLTPQDGKFNLSFRLYGAGPSVASCAWYPRPLVKQN